MKIWCGVTALLIMIFSAPCFSAALEDYPVTPEGIGRLKIGMTLAEARKAIKEDIIPHNGGTLNCDTAIIADTGLMLLIQNKKITAIHINNPAYKTPENAKIGDSEAILKTLYKTMEITPGSDYIKGHDIKIKTPQGSGYIFKTDDNKNVYEYRAGLYPAIELKEGCQ